MACNRNHTALSFADVSLPTRRGQRSLALLCDMVDRATQEEVRGFQDSSRATHWQEQLYDPHVECWPEERGKVQLELRSWDRKALCACKRTPSTAGVCHALLLSLVLCVQNENVMIFERNECNINLG